MAQSRYIRLSVDIGGTFTDIVLDTPDGMSTAKVLTTAQAPELGVIEAVDRILHDNGVTHGEVSVLIHGTTLATNALIERKGAVTAFLTTEGFRDILETGFEQRFEQYDVFMDKPAPLVPRSLRLPVRERLSATGRVLIPLDHGQVRKVAARLKKEGVQAVAVGLMNAYAHDGHEQQVGDLLAEELPEATICLSSEVCPEIREYERFSTTCANAYVRPLISGYLHRLRELLDRRQVRCPFLLMTSSGGLTTLDNAARFPIRLVESGPAGGAVLASSVAADCGLDEVLSFDMGGTTAKICLIRDGRPDRSRVFEIARAYRDIKGSGLPVRVPVLEMVEIGAGGGSIGRVDEMGRIRVGPQSAGSDPGPACYDLGGENATVTDANLALGRLDPDQFAGGKIRLQAKRSEDALARDIGEAMGYGDHWPAVGVIEIVEENMANAARVHAIERGRVIGRHTMVAFGGGAPLHAGRLAQKLGIDRVVIPRSAGVGSAVGLLLAPISYEVVRSKIMLLSALEAEDINAMLQDMEEQATALVVQGAAPGARLVTRRTVELRYLGQGHELRIAVDDGPLGPQDTCRLRQKFETLYADVYGQTVREMDVETVTWSVNVSTDVPSVNFRVDRTTGPRIVTDRDLYDSGLEDFVSAPVYWRSEVQRDEIVSGPAVIAEEETTTIVPAGFVATVNGPGHIVMLGGGTTQ